MGSREVRTPAETILVTGFGPFSVHERNASWEAVQLLKQLGLNMDINLVVEHIPVEYGFVLERVRNLWDMHKPKLVVHCGVSGLAEHLTLEQQAHNTGYVSVDNKGSLPDDGCCISCAPDVLTSGFEMNKICSTVNDKSDVKAVISDDPGRYLCDFIYYTSLSIDPRRTAFIHVPPIGKPYSVEQLAKAIRLAIMAMLDQLVNSESSDCEQNIGLPRPF